MTDQEFFSSFREKAEAGLKLWESPSVSVGVIKDGKVVLCDGFGLRDVEQNLPADKHTLYQIGSCSKAFTCALAAKLVDAGKLDWDTPIKSYVPEISFYDDYVTQHVTLRDLVSHRTGLPRHEYSWYGTDYTKAELLQNLKFLEPNQPVRQKFQYNNQCYILTGYICERVTGKTFEQLLDEYLFGPLHMTHSNAFIADITGSPDHAEPYDRTDPDVALKGMKKIPFYKMPVEDKEKGVGAPLGPAGSINSCVEDMLNWVQMHLDNGKFQGEQVISEANVAQLHKPNMILDAPLDMPMPETCLWRYSMGWFIENFRGIKVYHHGGNINGFSGFTCFVPELNLGVVAYTNMNGSYLHFALARTVIDHYLGIHDTDWVQRYHDFIAERAAKTQDSLKVFTGDKVEGTSTSHALSEFAGTYKRPGYNPATITLEDGSLYLNFAETKVRMKHFHYDTFVLDEVVGELPAGIPVHFYTADVGGAVAALSMPLVTEPGAALIRFERV